MPLVLALASVPAYILTVVLLWPSLGPVSLIAGTVGASIGALLAALWVIVRRSSPPTDY